jgi:formylglycine-generating enzyme required for sulfatase activity
MRWLRFCVLPALAGALFALPGGGAPAPVPPTAPITSSIGMKLVRIKPGKFTMGSPAEEVGHQAREGPQREVTITKPFYLGVYEVTQAEYRKVRGTNPSYFSPTGGGKVLVAGQDTTRFPVETVSWAEAVEFCKKLSDLPAERRARRVYRLPTEAEWEYACRAGTSTPFAFGKSASSKQANFNGFSPYGGGAPGPSLNRPCAVGSYKPNAWGLFDMHGNVYEWCADWHGEDYYRTGPTRDPRGPEKGEYRILRGGSWANTASICRSAERQLGSVGGRANFIGFRVACVTGR